MGKFTISTAIVIAGLFVSAAQLGPTKTVGGGVAQAVLDIIEPGFSLTKGGITIQNHINSQGPITAYPLPVFGGQVGWSKIVIDSGENSTITVLEDAPAGNLLKLRILVKGTGRLRLGGTTGLVPKPLGKVPRDMAQSTGIIVSGQGALTLEGDASDQITVLREHVVVRTTKSSTGTVIGLKAANATVLLCDSDDIVNINAAPIVVMQY